MKCSSFVIEDEQDLFSSKCWVGDECGSVEESNPSTSLSDRSDVCSTPRVEMLPARAFRAARFFSASSSRLASAMWAPLVIPVFPTYCHICQSLWQTPSGWPYISFSDQLSVFGRRFHHKISVLATDYPTSAPDALPTWVGLPARGWRCSECRLVSKLLSPEFYPVG